MREYDETTLKVAERVLKRSDEIISRREKRAATIKHISYALSGICAAVIINVSIWHSNAGKNLPENNETSIITEISETTTSDPKKTSTAVISGIKTTSMNKTTASATTVNTVSSDKASQIGTNVNASQVTAISTSVSNISSETVFLNDINTSQTTLSVSGENLQTTLSHTSVTITDMTNDVTDTTKHSTVTSTKPVPSTTITTTNRPTLEEVVQFPTEGRFPIKITIVDEISNEAVKDLDIELYTLDKYDVDADLIDKIAEWNTSAYETYSCELPYSFENRDSYSAYGVVIKNMPEDYVYTFSGENSKCFPFDYRPMTIWTDIVNGNTAHEHEYVIRIKKGVWGVFSVRLYDLKNIQKRSHD
ncbi:hypothetical protein [uncultured Ruminococcus sp.]|uniref:hypothetical protein n=1 Tax=uncultured Ruminococcus sp. TaxID=165186 RepID=UPI0025FE1B8F|nr:hypothetical protein [uncultured Ruminococcus sp.]